MPYTPTTWVNGSAPALSATNLNNIETGISNSVNKDGSVAMTAQLVTVAGSATTPSIAPIGDTNTGIFFPTADTIAFVEGGAEVFRITSIGTFNVSTAGTQTTPIITNLSDTNTGLYWASADKLAITEGGRGLTFDEFKMSLSMGAMI
jgi:hypothetical protein